MKLTCNESVVPSRASAGGADVPTRPGVYKKQSSSLPSQRYLLFLCNTALDTFPAHASQHRRTLAFLLAERRHNDSTEKRRRDSRYSGA
jgi:hypothetical protein